MICVLSRTYIIMLKRVNAYLIFKVFGRRHEKVFDDMPPINHNYKECSFLNIKDITRPTTFGDHLNIERDRKSLGVRSLLVARIMLRLFKAYF